MDAVLQWRILSTKCYITEILTFLTEVQLLHLTDIVCLNDLCVLLIMQSVVQSEVFSHTSVH